MLNCTDGPIDDSKFSEPTLTSGLIAAAATLVCILAMIADLTAGFQSKQKWMPSGYFSLNAIFLAVVGAAVKLSADMTSPMPSQLDQLAKLSTSAFLCIVLANIQPSLGMLENSELFANTVALCVLVISSILNLWFQLKTGAIYKFQTAHGVMLLIMYTFLSIRVSAASSLPVLKNYLQLTFDRQHQSLEGLFDDRHKMKMRADKLREYLTKFSMMSQSGCPHFVLARSLMCYMDVLYGFMAATTLFVILSATTIHKDKFLGSNTCSGESDYGWSVLVILITQTIAVVVGLMAPLGRLIYFYRTTRVGGVLLRWNQESPKTENFWMWNLNVTKEIPIFSYIEDRKQSYIFYVVKSKFSRLLFFYKYFIATIINMGSLFPALFRWLTTKDEGVNMQNSGLDNHTSPTHPGPNSKDLIPYFLHLEGEETLTKEMVESASSVTQKYLIDARKREPKLLIEFLEKHLSADFMGVVSFENDHVTPPLIDSEGSPPKCWALSVLTLTSIATALPYVDSKLTSGLKRSVVEGLVYVKLVEDNLNERLDLINIRAAANFVWGRFDRYEISLCIDLERHPWKKNPKETLEALANSAKEIFSRFISDQKKTNVDLLLADRAESTSEALAAYSLYKICGTLLQDCPDEEDPNLLSQRLFEKLSAYIADILGACFTNLKQCILKICSRSSIEKRRETAFQMLKIFGETERIMKILEERETKIPDLASDRLAFIDEWRSHLIPCFNQQP